MCTYGSFKFEKSEFTCVAIKIDKWSYGTHAEYMDLEIYRGNRFFEKGMFDIWLYQKRKINLREWGAKNVH